MPTKRKMSGVLTEQSTIIRMRPKKSATSRKVKFQLQTTEKSTVFLAGSFNNWDEKTLEMKPDKTGSYSITVALPKGRHEYKFLVNGVWQIDPNCPQWSQNSYGSLNSVIE